MSYRSSQNQNLTTCKHQTPNKTHQPTTTQWMQLLVILGCNLYLILSLSFCFFFTLGIFFISKQLPTRQEHCSQINLVWWNCGNKKSEGLLPNYLQMLLTICLIIDTCNLFYFVFYVCVVFLWWIHSYRSLAVKLKKLVLHWCHAPSWRNYGLLITIFQYVALPLNPNNSSNWHLH